MANVSWLIRRLKAMSIPEVKWRLSQKKIQKSEESRFKSKKQSITDSVFNDKLQSFVLDADRMWLNFSNREFGLNTDIPLLGGFDYSNYKKNWNAGFQTGNEWPDTFSYSLEYKQRDDIGDARTNWELNRHFQFALLAKDYAASGDKKHLDELTELFEDWNEKNPFLWGISWTSVMEVAIRCSNWCYTWCFLKQAKNVSDRLLENLRVGILNMTDYIANHYSRFSSANNHLIVEAYAIGQSGILFDNPEWTDLSVSILTRELTLQNYSDGINKELSLHYQSFYMEAMGLMMRLMVKNNISVPDSWYEMLTKMCRYLADCIGDYGEVVEFGDNDEGKILDLAGGLNHYEYVLQMFGILMDERYTDSDLCESVRWLFTESEIEAANKKSLYVSPLVASYKEGGNTILRSADRKVLIGIDHAALGFGSIAAHGHADALSFQLYLEGQPIFVDPGTYIYHCDIQARNAYRKTENHNTVCINGGNQSEMLGAFLWGKKAECKLLNVETEEDHLVVKAEHNGYASLIHEREFDFDGNTRLTITDCFKNKNDEDVQVNFIFAPDVSIEKDEGDVWIKTALRIFKMTFEADDYCINTRKLMFSKEYGIQTETTGIQVSTTSNQIKTIIAVD